jgi:hypothetical protein
MNATVAYELYHMRRDRRSRDERDREAHHFILIEELFEFRNYSHKTTC